MPGKAWIIQLIFWKYTDEWFVPEGTQPQRAFTSRTRAEAELQRQEQEARAAIVTGADEFGLTANIGRTFGALENITSLSLEELEQRMIVLGLSPFPRRRFANGGSYIDSGDDAWWENAWRQFGKNRTESFWALFDRIHFYEIVEVDLPPRFLVRPRPALLEKMQERGEDAYYPFENRTDAEQFAATNSPIHINPFLLAQDVEDWNLVFWLIRNDFEESENDSLSVPLSELKNRAVAIGLPPAGETEGWPGASWKLWWDRYQAQMTDDQKRSLWQFLIPHPYEIIALEVE